VQQLVLALIMTNGAINPESRLLCDGLIKLDRNLLTLKFLYYEKIKKNI